MFRKIVSVLAPYSDAKLLGAPGRGGRGTLLWGLCTDPNRVVWSAWGSKINLLRVLNPLFQHCFMRVRLALAAQSNRRLSNHRAQAP